MSNEIHEIKTDVEILKSSVNKSVNAMEGLTTQIGEMVAEMRERDIHYSYLTKEVEDNSEQIKKERDRFFKYRDEIEPVIKRSREAQKNWDVVRKGFFSNWGKVAFLLVMAALAQFSGLLEMVTGK
jgi:chromosome segregation ATPase